jgi:hypothetical protein
MPESHFTVLDGYPADVIAISASGHITSDDYEKVLIPLVEDRIKAEGKVKLLYMLTPEFAGFSAGAMWDDAKLGLLHFGDFAKVALVTDIDWMRAGTKLFAPLMRFEVRVYPVAELDAAKAWISEYHAEPPRQPKAAASPVHDRGRDEPV